MRQIALLLIFQKDMAVFIIKTSGKFYYYSRGSLSETKTWITKAKNRNKMDQAIYDMVYGKLKSLHKSLNSAIKKLPIN